VPHPHRVQWGHPPREALLRKPLRCLLLARRPHRFQGRRRCRRREVHPRRRVSAVVPRHPRRRHPRRLAQPRAAPLRARLPVSPLARAAGRRRLRLRRPGLRAWRRLHLVRVSPRRRFLLWQPRGWRRRRLPRPLAAPRQRPRRDFGLRSSRRCRPRRFKVPRLPPRRAVPVQRGRLHLRLHLRLRPVRVPGPSGRRLREVLLRRLRRPAV
jgi:hypothetical protein